MVFLLSALLWKKNPRSNKNYESSFQLNRNFFSYCTLISHVHWTICCTCIQAFWIKCAARKLIPLLARFSLPLYDTNAGFVCLTALGTSNGGLEGDFCRATLSDLAEAAIWISEHHALFRSYQIKQNQRCYTARLKYCKYLLRADIFVYITVVFAIIIISL